MPVDTETRAILDAALRYVVQKSDQGVTVGLHFGGDNYGEARAPTATSRPPSARRSTRFAAAWSTGVTSTRKVRQPGRLDPASAAGGGRHTSRPRLVLAMIVPRFCREISGGGRFYSGWGSLILRSTLVLVLLLCCIGGCATHVSPPANVRDPTTVYLTNYGRHASLILPTAPGTLTEYSYGDWTFYAEAKTTPANALAALFWSRQAALGRRSLAEYSDPAQLARDLKANVQPVCVEREAVTALGQRLEGRRATPPNRDLQPRIPDLLRGR